MSRKKVDPESEIRRAVVFRWTPLKGGIIFAAVLLSIGVGMALGSSIRSDERVLFFPTSGHLDKDGETWVIPVRGWIFEPELDSLKRRALLKVAAKTLRLESENGDRKRFTDRAAMFLVDNERGKEIPIRLGTHSFNTKESGPNGHFRGEVRLPRADLKDLLEDGRVALSAGREGGKRGDDLFLGAVQLLEAEGVSVISDIDDTIKISNVLEKRKLLANTFTKPFKSAPGMVRLYQSWSKQGAAFHYVSSSPWQLFPFLDGFMRKAGFPRGSFHLRLFRPKDRTVLNLLKSSLETKPPEIEPLLEAYPRRRFILSGDSGEQDPEIYGRIARKYPNQVLHIYIRDVLKEGMAASRIKEVFKDVPSGHWTVFKNAKDLPQGLPKASASKTP